MISMQRSLSSPVRVYSEPPTSPTAHYDSNTPANKSHDTPVSPLQHLRSRSPPRSSSIAVPAPTVNLPFRRSEDGTRRGTYTPYSHANSSIPSAVNTKKPLITHDLPHRSKHASFDSSIHADQNSPPTDSAGAASPIISKPLLQDTSLYTNPHLTREIESTTLEELAHLVRLSKFQERKRASTRIRLQRSLISTALSARLTRCGEIANRNLADNFRRDDKESFVALFNAVYDVRKSCQELRRFALLEPDSEPLLPTGSPSDTLDGSVNLDAGPLRPQNPFFDDLAASSRDTFLDFITQIRTNPDYLATRICALSSSELNALCASHKGLEPFDSVLPFQGRSSSRSHSASGSRNNASADIERLLSFHRHDPLSVLVHTCFANSAGPDSSEDRRRTDIWATTLAKLISEPKSSGEHLVISVLNIWTTMREWSGRSNMEWFLLKILEDGAFLLDRAEDQHGTRFNLSDWNQSDEAAAADFYDHAVNELFELVDDEDATGIPEGLLELGHAILQKLDGPFLENTTRWLVWRCLFFVFFTGVIVHPESYGMLTEYHITPYAREKVLKKVAMKAYDYVSRMWTGKPSSTSVPQEIPPKIKGHVESIIARFQGTRPRVPAAKLLPARSITSLRETAEVHPYLVISPTELLTMVNALFPERRPQSSASMRSGPTPLSGMSSLSHPISITGSSNDFETASIISTSASSVPLGTPTMHERSKELIEPMSPGRLSPTRIDQDAERKLRNYEDDGHRLRIALHEMAQSLGHDALQGHAHPCAERWAVLFISPEGRTLSTHMTYDPEEEVEEDDNSSSSDTDDDSEDDGAQLDKDYLQLRDAILKLVEDYEIPQSLEPESESAHLSNRASRLRRYKSKNRIITPERSKPSKNPYRRRNHEDSPTRESATSPYHDRLPQAQEEPDAVLVTMLKAAAAQSKAHADFVSSHMYWKTLVQLNALDSPSLRQNGFSVLINIFSRGPRDSIRRSASAIEEYDAWLVWLKQSQERHDGSIERMMARIRAMRNKMWYVTEVRNSREYAHSRDICQALKTMGMPRRWSSFQRTRANLARGPGTSYLYRTESQIMDLLAAGEEQGGPNKLSGDQADVTSRWLKEYDVENFCRGEERIHRFCCEVDKCVSKLVAETISDAPVLWSSDLYKRDKLVFDRLRASEREASDDTSSIASDNERFGAGIGNRLSPLAKDLRTGLGQHEYFERTSSAQAVDFNTFWSPFQGSNSPGQLSRAYSPASSVTNLSSTLYNTAQPWVLPQPSGTRFSGRPGTAMSSAETIHQRRADTRMSKFLSDLKRSLTSLLLSDLGTQVFSRGSETDVWFRGLGQECIDRKDALDRRAKQRRKERGARGTGRPRVIEKKKSFGNLRGAGDNVFDQMDMPAGSPSSSTATPTTPRMNTGQLSRKEDEFPFKKAYQRLLSMFTVHPNPFAKLMALKELEDLIVASVAVSGSKRSRRNRSDAGSSVVTDEEVPSKRSSSFDSVIENVKERRSLAMQQSLPLPGSIYQRQESSDVQSIMSVYTNHTDAVVNELQSLFRDASIRPSSLFRDLQLIAAFVPGVILDRPELGKAFWNAGLAALQLKAEVCHTMVEMADEVVAARTQTRSASDALFTQSNVPLSSTGTPPPASASYKLEDAGKMWTITAKEGSATAQRELALFYLSNPEYVERTTLPLSKPREVFKQAVMEKYGRGKSMSGGAPSSGINPPAATAGGRVSGGNGNTTGGTANGGGSLETKEKDVRNDPGLMCVAVHWMDAAMRGGDELATSFLRQNDPWS